MEKKKKKRNRSIYDKKDGFYARVNLYIIRHLYYHLKTKKAEQFIYETETTARTASVDLYEFTGLSRQVFYKAFRGGNFSLPSRVLNTITYYFNLDRKYFQKDGKLIEIKGITEDDWKCFFECKYPGSVPGYGFKPKDDDEYDGGQRRSQHDEKLWQGYGRVEEQIANITDGEYITENYGTDTAIFRLYYYLTRGEHFQEASRLGQFMDSLSKLRIADWKELEDNLPRMEGCLRLLQKHGSYVEAYIKCRKYEAEN